MICRRGPAIACQQGCQAQPVQRCRDVGCSGRQKKIRAVLQDFDQNTTGGKGQAGPELWIPAQADQQLGYRFRGHFLDQEAVGHGLGIMGGYSLDHPSRGAFQRGKVGKVQGDGPGFGLVGQAGADHLQRDREAQVAGRVGDPGLFGQARFRDGQAFGGKAGFALRLGQCVQRAGECSV